MKAYKTPFALRGDWLYCPLPVALDVYWSCAADCVHCCSRRLNRTWGNEQRVVDPTTVHRALSQSMVSARKRTRPLSQALAAGKAIMIGRKTDPYQPVETQLRVTRQVIKAFLATHRPFVIRTKFPGNAQRDTDLFEAARKLATILVETTCGAEKDWELFEHRRTAPIKERLSIVQHWRKLGINASFRGEPFIPGYHTTTMFRQFLQRLADCGIPSYNTYNLHMNDHNLKRLHEIGLDIEQIWKQNQDHRWKPVQQELCRIAEEEGIILGCPDFVNTGPNFKNCTNTCCGVDVPGAFKFNAHRWKRLRQRGMDIDQIWSRTWEGIGTEADRAAANIIIGGRSCHYYTLKDAGL